LQIGLAKIGVLVFSLIWKVLLQAFAALFSFRCVACRHCGRHPDIYRQDTCTATIAPYMFSQMTQINTDFMFFLTHQWNLWDPFLLAKHQPRGRRLFCSSRI